MKLPRVTGAFSLIEVIVAVGLFAGSIAVILGLMGPLARQTAESADALAAQRLPEPIRVELRRLAGTNLDGLAGQIPIMSAPLDNGFALIAPRDATRVQSLVYLPPLSGQVPSPEQYYLVECWRFPSKPGDPTDQLSYNGQKGFLALHVRVSWPYQIPGGPAATPLAGRRQITFTVSLNR